MAQLVGEHRLDFRVREPLEQRVEEDDALVAADAGEVGVAVARAARVVDHEDPLGGESRSASSERLDALSQRLRPSSGEKRLKSGAMNAGHAQAIMNITASQSPRPTPTTSARRAP